MTDKPAVDNVVIDHQMVNSIFRGWDLSWPIGIAKTIGIYNFTILDHRDRKTRRTPRGYHLFEIIFQLADIR